MRTTALSPSDGLRLSWRHLADGRAHHRDLFEPPGDAPLLAVLGVDRAHGQGRDRREGEEDRGDDREQEERLVEEPGIARRHGDRAGGRCGGAGLHRRRDDGGRGVGDLLIADEGDHRELRSARLDSLGDLRRDGQLRCRRFARRTRRRP